MISKGSSQLTDSWYLEDPLFWWKDLYYAVLVHIKEHDHYISLGQSDKFAPAEHCLTQKHQPLLDFQYFPGYKVLGAQNHS